MTVVEFHQTITGDCIALTHKDHTYLIDCGYGLNYPTLFPSVSGLMLSHTHGDHWAALPEVLPLLTNDGWVAKSGSTFADSLMLQQSSYFHQTPVDLTNAIAAYLALPAEAMPTVHLPGFSMRNVNMLASATLYIADTWDHLGIHHGCLVPLVETEDCTLLFGTDLETDDWEELLNQGLLPQNVSLFQAPNHGQIQGRVSERVFNHLRPAITVISDADPNANDNYHFYAKRGGMVITTKESGTTRFVIENGKVTVR
jgi:beta-lactamase superfamily II metal-dependent hydrolase